MQVFPIISLWTLIFFIKLIQCEINTTFFPSIILHPYQDLPLTDQAIYDLRNTMRKTNEINDYDDEDYNEDDEIEINYQLIPSIQSTTSTIEYITPKSSSSSSSHFIFKFRYLLLLVLTQTNK